MKQILTAQDLITPEAFMSKYKDLSIKSERISYGFGIGSNSHTIIRLTTKNPDSWYHLVSYDIERLQLDPKVEKKYPKLKEDLWATRPYYEVFNRNAFRKSSFKVTPPKELKPFLVKADTIKEACEHSEPHMYKKYDFAKEAELLNVAIEVSRNGGIDNIQRDYYEGELAAVRFTFKTPTTTGEYAILLTDLTSGFRKLLFKYLEDSYNLIW